MYRYNAKLIRVVDGDTIDAHIDLGFDVHVKKRIRLAGINAPESRTRNKIEKKLGLAAKERLIQILEGAAEKILVQQEAIVEINVECGELIVNFYINLLIQVFFC